MVSHIPSVLLGVYALMTLALGETVASVCGLALATALLISRHFHHHDAEIKDLQDSIQAHSHLIYNVQSSIAKMQDEVRALSNVNSDLKDRLGSMANDMSKFQKSDDPWSGQ